MKKTRVKSHNKSKINRRVTKKRGGDRNLENDRGQLMDEMHKNFDSNIEKIKNLIEFIKKWRENRYVNKGVNFKYIRKNAPTTGWTPLTLACRYGSLDIVKVLVEVKGANVNYQNLVLDTPLMVSCKNKKLDIVEYLLKKVRM